MKRNLLLSFFAVLSVGSYAQLNIQSGATFFIQSGATVTVQGDITANADIQGTGTLLLKGSAAQNVNMNGFTVNANLEIDNTNNIILAGLARTAGLLTFTNGKIVLGNNNFIMASTASFAGAGTGKFAETNGTGQLRREISANGSYTLPVGTGTRYTPVQFTTSGSSFASAFVAGRAVNGGHPTKHPRSSDYLNQYWSLSRSGITGGTVTTVGTYSDGTDVTGIESDLRAMRYDGAAWTMTGASQDNAANTVTAPMPNATGDLYAMNRYVLSTPTVFLQASFNTGTNQMGDLLRNSGAYTPGVLPASNLIPLSDPYRAAPYAAAGGYTHVANTIPETIASSVLNDQAVSSTNIVDWVFLELRTVSSPTVAPVVQTRSALIRKDGVIVDVDGISPVYFKNVDAGTNYVISVRHRNHLGLSINPATPVSLGLSNSAFNFATAPAGSIFGTAGSNYTTLNGFNVLWAGNANHNANVRYTGIGNDKDVIQADFVISGTGANYYRADLNHNRVIRYTGINNDKDYLLSNIIQGSAGRNQALPN
jgi:hypothetical protein